MIIRLERIYNCPKYCIGHLYADGKYVCDTIEDTDRGLDNSWTTEAIRKKEFDFYGHTYEYETPTGATALLKCFLI